MGTKEAGAMAESVTSCFERYEKKYRITKAQQRRIIEKMKPYMQADKFGKYTICNIYYDTRDWRLIRSSIEKPAYKEKLRVRSYGTPDADGKVFVEVKKKYDGIVYKRRITMPARQTRQFLSGGSAAGYGQIGREIGWLSSFYGAEPKVFIAYDRLAFAGTDDPELRITFDTNLRWRDTELDLTLGDWGELIIPADEVIMEIKIPRAAPMWLSRLLSEVGAFPSSFSKYGTCYKNKILKKEAQCCA